uniref:UDP-glucose 4-epimerase family protein n=1 Tax=Geobacter pickeringii TaxID=345632 RepID=UPI000A0490C7
MQTTNKNVFVTGASGFVGRFLCSRLLSAGFSVRGTLLSSETPASLVSGVEPMVIQPLGPDTPWQHALTGIDTIIHLAARVHIMDDPSADPLTEFRKVNTEGTRQLAKEAAKAGVKRLVFISSIKVNGEETATPFTENSPAQPTDPYGISKWEAEQSLRQIEKETGLEVVVVRPTLVYGPGVKANFLNVLKAIKGNSGFWILDFGSKYLPFPLASIANQRSLIYVGNLVDALATCATHPVAAGQTYLVSDGEDVSTPELIRRVANALDVPARLVPLPVSWMKAGGEIVDCGLWILNSKFFNSNAGKPIQNSTSRNHSRHRFTAAVNRLTGSLTVDSFKIRKELGWTPPFTMEEGLRETAKWFEKQC